MAFAGPRNRQGEKGDPGRDGLDGSQWFSDAGEPQKSIGKKGDFYLDTKNGDVYRKQTKEWIWITNLKGPKGNSVKGDPGKPGKDGVTKVIHSESFSVGGGSGGGGGSGLSYLAVSMTITLALQNTWVTVPHSFTTVAEAEAYDSTNQEKIELDIRITAPQTIQIRSKKQNTYTVRLIGE